MQEWYNKILLCQNFVLDSKPQGELTLNFPVGICTQEVFALSSLRNFVVRCMDYTIISSVLAKHYNNFEHSNKQLLLLKHTVCK